MTEYDYSPEAYERHLATQTRIANWVDTTEAHRSEYEHALNTPVPTAPTVKHRAAPRAHAGPPPPPPLNLGIHYGMAPPPPLPHARHAPTPRSGSSDGYAAAYAGTGPGPMPLPMGYAPPPAYAPMLPPGAHQQYMSQYVPGHRPRPSSHSHHSHSSGRSHRSQGYYTVTSPLPSPPAYGYPYAQPPQAGGYFVVQHPHQSGPVMYLPPH